MSTLEARLARLEAIVAIQELVARYCIGADQHDENAWQHTWTDDAVWEAGGDEEHIFRGRTAINAAVAGQWATFPRMQHTTSNHTIDFLDNEHATGRCDMVIMVQLPDTSWMIGGGIYEDRYLHTPTGWRIQHRRVNNAFDIGPLMSMPPFTDEPNNDVAS
jgi:hypothetical protein